MIKNNKIINKVLLPKVLSLAAIVAFATGAAVYTTQNNVAKTNYAKRQDIWLICLVALLMICICADLYSDYKKGEKYSSQIARKYLKKEFENHPEFKRFEKVLNNPKAMQNISALVFNSLRPSERKYITQIVLDAHKNLRTFRKYSLCDAESSKNIKILFNNVRDQIICVLQEHAAMHPEFINDLYSAMASADNMTYIMTKKFVKQNTK